MEVSLSLLKDKNSIKAKIVKKVWTKGIRSNEITECHVQREHTLVGTPGLGFVSLVKPLVGLTANALVKCVHLQ